MDFNLKRVDAPVEKLIWQDMKQIDFKFNLPLLINRRGEVLLGNCQKQHVLKRQSQDVIVVQIDDYMKKVLNEIEIVVVEENSIERYHAIEKELKVYIDSFDNDYELLSLFDDEELRETRLITNDNFIKPLPYNFEKRGRKDEYIEEEFNIFEID